MKKYSIALDIGATKILGGVIFKNKILTTLKKPTQSKTNRRQIIQNITNVITELIDCSVDLNMKLEKIGIGFAGQVDRNNGIILSTTNFISEFKNVKLADILKKKFSVPVQIDNDVKCFVIAEGKFGAGKNSRHLVGLTLGTGIGGSILMDGKIWRGINNSAGEIGHMKISGQWIGSVPVCGCGQRYCWESVASGRAWQNLNKKYNSNKADEIIVSNIVIGLLNLSYILDPEIFILGGGLMEHGNLLPKIQKVFLSGCQFPWFKKIKIVPARLGDSAILLGSLL